MIYNSEQVYRNVTPDNLLAEVAKKKRDGKRLLELFATYIEKAFVIHYVFDEGDYNVECLCVAIECDQVLESIGDIFPYATTYESEASELFGVKIKMPASDIYHHRLYKVAAETPFTSPYGALMGGN